MREQATRLLRAFAASDLETIDELCADDVLLWGTDAGEVWRGKTEVLAGFAGAFSLSVDWVGEPDIQGEWVAGNIEFALPDSTPLAARVTMVFRDGLLAHAHYSVAVTE
jgi:ketosteroid isomerase-like protein